MILEPVRIVADWLADASYGVNALRLLVDVDAGDAQPGAVVIADETRNGLVARGMLPARTSTADNLIAVNSGAGGLSFEGGVLTTVRDGTVPLVVRIGVMGQEPSEDATRDGAYLARVVFQSLKVLMQADHADDRTRNSVHIKDLQDISMQGVFQSLNDQTVTYAVTMMARVRDLTP